MKKQNTKDKKKAGQIKKPVNPQNVRFIKQGQVVFYGQHRIHRDN